MCYQVKFFLRQKLLLFIKIPHKVYFLFESMLPWEWKNNHRKKVQHLPTMVVQIVQNLISLFYYIQAHLIYIEFHFSDSQFYLVCIQYFDLCSLISYKYIQSHLICTLSSYLYSIYSYIYSVTLCTCIFNLILFLRLLRYSKQKNWKG